MIRRVVAAFAVLLSAVVMTVALGARAEAAAAFSADWRAHVEFGADGRAEIAFSADVDGEYDLFCFPTDSGLVRAAKLLCGAETVAEGDGGQLLMSVTLAADTEYILRLEGEGFVDVELMRRITGRSLLMPAEPDAEEPGGLIVLPGNAMWHSIGITAANASVYISPTLGGLDLRAEVFASDGRRVADSEDMPGGACRLYFRTRRGEEYVLRISSPDGGTGGYSIRIIETDMPAPQSVVIASDELSMREGDMRAVSARIWPADADGSIVWASSDENVAVVNEHGVITAVSNGSAYIYAYAGGGLSASLPVTVEVVEPEYIAYRGGFINIRVGDVLTPSMQVYPAAAADDGFISFSSDAPDIVSVSRTGEISALSEGTALVVAEYGVLRAELTVYVEEAPARYRALLISEQNYLPEVNSVRQGAVNTVYNLEALFSTASFDGEECAVTVEIDLTAEETIAAIRSAFDGAQEKDISILYLSCHGYYRDGMTVFQFSDGSELAACDLEPVLRSVPGTIVILADCCDSGGLIDGRDDSAALSGGVVSAFSGGDAVFSSSKYKVLASAAVGQDSYRLGYGDDASVATVFARALCDALGWDMDDQRRGALNADMNYDGQITLWEAYQYTGRRVMWYLSRAGGEYTQNVQVYPQGDMFVLYER